VQPSRLCTVLQVGDGLAVTVPDDEPPGVGADGELLAGAGLDDDPPLRGGEPLPDADPVVLAGALLVGAGAVGAFRGVGREVFCEVFCTAVGAPGLTGGM
jgi:hypothetical protein